MSKPTPEEVQKHILFNPETGLLYWRLPRSGRNLDRPAGKLSTRIGRRLIGFNYKSYMASIITWVVCKGEWPTQEIDHRDGNKLNDHIDNLRLATHSENNHSRSAPQGMNRGTFQVGSKWRAMIKKNKKVIHLGYFHTRAEARAAYAAASKELFGEFSWSEA